MKPTVELLEEAREELCGCLDCIHHMLGPEDELYIGLEGVEAKLTQVYKRLVHPVVQQEEAK